VVKATGSSGEILELKGMSTMRPTRAIATILLVAGLAAAGCGNAEPDQRGTASGQPPSLTAPATTTRPSTGAPATSRPPATHTPATTNRGAGSEPAVLTDGRHPVRLKTVDPDRRRVTFDVIQFYFGEDAAREAAKDHKESPPPNDYYIRNVNPRLRTLPVRSDATITVNTLAAGYTGSAIKNVQVQLYRLDIMLDFRGSSPPFWITVRNDQVTRIAEQYIP
jgi:hypothetical protein